MNYTSSAFQIKSLKDTGELEGYASVFNVIDKQGDVISFGAFSETLQNNKFPKFLWQHDQTQLIGVWKELKEDAHGLFVKGQLLLDIQKAQEAYHLIKNGVLDGLSIGYRPIKTKKYNKSRYILSVDLIEISLVTFPANEQACVTDLKNIQPWLTTEIQKLTEILRSK